MNKIRIEALSDGVFAIVMTILVLELKVPHIRGEETSNQLLWQKLIDLWPVFRSYLISFLIVGMYWLAHSAFFHLFTRQVNRVLANFNTLFLMFVSLIPFSAHLLGEYPRHYPAILIYGLNIIVVGLILFLMLRLAIHDHEVRHEAVSQRLIVQATVRVLLPPGFALLGMLVAGVNISFSFFLFFFPIVFNLIPGSLDFMEWLIFKRRRKAHQEMP